VEGGWIKLYREIRESRFWPQNRRYTELEAWVDILLSANHADKMVGNILVKRGQWLTSFQKLSKRWKWDRKTVRKWATLLVTRGDILYPREGTRDWTLITVCKYKQYQAVKTKTPQEAPQDNPQDDPHPNPHRVPQDAPHKQEVKNARKEKEAVNPVFNKPNSKDKNSPVSKFKWWVADNQDWIIEAGKELYLGLPKIVDEIVKMKAWVLSNPKKAPKSDYKRFVGSWLARAREDKNNPRRAPITNAEEQAHYDKHRSRTTTDLGVDPRVASLVKSVIKPGGTE